MMGVAWCKQVAPVKRGGAFDLHVADITGESMLPVGYLALAIYIQRCEWAWILPWDFYETIINWPGIGEGCFRHEAERAL